MPPQLSTKGYKLNPEAEMVKNEGVASIKLLSLRHKHFVTNTTEMLRVGDYG
jgi:hypothetical protein